MTTRAFATPEPDRDPVHPNHAHQPNHAHHPQQLAHSVEPTRLTYLLRRAAVGAAMLALVVVGLTTVGGLSLSGTVASEDALAQGVARGAMSGPAAGANAQPDSPPPTTVQPSVAVPDAPSPPSLDAGPDAPPDVLQGPEIPNRASRFLAEAPRRVLDTRSAGAPPPPGSGHAVAVPAGRTAVALSVTVMGAGQAGAVTVDGGAGAVTAISIGGALGTTEARPTPVSTTNLVVVPVVGSTVTARSSAGGHLVVDVVGSFEDAIEVAGGRFVPVDPVRVARLETAIEGREAELPLQSATRDGNAAAYLVEVVADVGRDGGVVRFGTSPAQYDQMLMWGPGVDGDQQRRGLVLIRPSDAGTAFLRYDGGTLLTADVVGYFTSKSAADSAGGSADVETAGLYVPSGPRQLVGGGLDGVAPTQVGGINPASGTALVVIGDTARRDASGSFTLPVVDGTLALPVQAGEFEAALLGVFIG